jgi:hypothetical protein
MRWKPEAARPRADGPSTRGSEARRKSVRRGRESRTERWKARGAVSDGATHGEEVKTWERTRTRRGERRRARLNPGPEERIESRSNASKSRRPEVASVGSRFPWEPVDGGESKGGNGREARAGEESAQAAAREKPLNGETNPVGGSGMQQARKLGSGTSRREVEKT